MNHCRSFRPAHVTLLCACLITPAGNASAQPSEWIQLFNGRDLSNWTVKIARHELGINFANTFRVENGVIRVSYDGYGAFDNQFGHLFYQQPFTDYHLAVEYRFVGNWLPDTPDWARRNSGVMLHAQDPRTMLRDQDFPISIEVQFLGGFGDNRPRTTANMCSPGTEVNIDGQQARAHCVNSRSATFDGDQWVRVEAIVYGDSIIHHVVNGDTVMTYTSPRVGGGVVNGFDPLQKVDGRPLTSGFIALQSEGHPIEFRKVELRPLSRRPVRR
jgi:hypothetical protein